MAALRTKKPREEKPTNISSRRGTYWTIGLVTWVATKLMLFWSLFRWQTVTTADAASHIPMGLPFPFLYQDQSWHHSGEVPIRTRFLAPQEFVTHTIWPNYILDLILVWGALLLLAWLVSRVCGGSSQQGRETGRLLVPVDGRQKVSGVRSTRLAELLMSSRRARDICHGLLIP